MNHLAIYRHNDVWDRLVRERSAACGYSHKLESMLRPGCGASAAFKQGVVVRYRDAICGRPGYDVTLLDGTSHLVRCYRGLQDVLEDVAKHLQNGMEDALGDWHAIEIRRYGESGDIQDLLAEICIPA